MVATRIASLALRSAIWMVLLQDVMGAWIVVLEDYGCRNSGLDAMTGTAASNPARSIPLWRFALLADRMGLDPFACAWYRAARQSADGERAAVQGYFRTGGAERSAGSAPRTTRAPAVASARPSRYAACAALTEPVRRYSPERCCRAVVSLMPSSKRRDRDGTGPDIGAQDLELAQGRLLPGLHDAFRSSASHAFAGSVTFSSTNRSRIRRWVKLALPSSPRPCSPATPAQS